MDEECLARGIYTFEEGDAVVIASRAAYYKFFQTGSPSADSEAAKNVQGGRRSYKVRQRAQPSSPDAADANARVIGPPPSPWPSDPIYRSIGKVVQVRPTGHVDVIFECGRDGTGNPQEPPETPRSRVGRTDGIENTTYTVVPDAVVKVPQLLERDLVKVVHDIRAGRSMKTTNDCRVFPKMIPVAFVVEGSDGNADNISVTTGFDIECSTSRKLELIARPAVGDFRATLKDYCSSESFAKKWFRGMQDFMQELPDVNMEPRRMASPYAPGNVVKVSEDLTMTLHWHVEKLLSGRRNKISDSISPNKRQEITLENAFKSLKRYGKVLQVNSSGYDTVLFTDGTVWHIQSSFLELVKSWKGCSNGEGKLFPGVLSTKVDTLILDVLSLDTVEIREGCLRAACFSGNKELLSLKRTEDVNVECEDKNRNRLLHYAAHSNQREMITHLLSLGANINATNNRSHTALQVATKEGFLGCVRELAKHHNRLNPNIQDDIGNTALHVAIANTNVGIFNELMQLPNVDFTLTNKHGLNALHMAALKGDATMTEKLLSKMNGLVDVKQQDHGYAALHFAAVNGHCHVVETLLTQESCTVDLPNEDQKTALLLAAKQGYWAVVELLILAGANVHLADRHGNTALHLSLMAFNEHSGDHQDMPTHPAMKAVEKKILEHGHTNSDTRLRMACFLLRCGADISCRNEEGITPLEIAHRLGQPSQHVLVFVHSCTWIPESGKCQGCLEAPAEISFTPCGHCLYCKDCAQPMTRCFSCGTFIVERPATGHIPLTKPMPETIKVKPATSPKLTSDVYSMRQNPRGRCIIINNVNFDGSLEDREGSELDADCMKTLFTQLHFNVTVASNLTRDEMKDLLRRVSKAKSHRFADCLVVILMSHGEEGFIYGSDGERLRLQHDVYGPFNNEECPTLQGKPKIFLVQACRGGEWDSGTDDVRIRADSPNLPDGTSTVTSEPTRNRIPVLSDMYIAYATIPGYIALRNRATGSWFLSAVTKVFSEHACSTSLDGLMHRVHEMVMECQTLDGSKQTPSVNKNGWTKEFYFNPGYFE